MEKINKCPKCGNNLVVKTFSATVIKTCYSCAFTSKEKIEHE